MKPLRIALVATLTLAIVGLWLASIDLAEMGHALTRARPAWLVLAGAGSLLHLVVRAWRWRLLLGPGGTGAARTSDLVRYTVMGYAVTFVIPGRAGEIVRPALLWSRAGVPFGRALGSVVLERVLDVAALTAFLVAFVLLEPERSPHALKVGAAVLLACVAVALVALTLLARRHRPLADRMVLGVASRLPARIRAPLAGFATSLLDGLDAALRAHGPLPILGASLLTWAPVMLTSAACLVAMAIEAPAVAPLALVPITAVGIAVPTPAGVGGFHAAATWALVHLFGVDGATAAAAAIVTHAVSVLPVLAAGLYACWREGLSISALRREAAAAAPPPETASP